MYQPHLQEIYLCIINLQQQIRLLRKGKANQFVSIDQSVKFPLNRKHKLFLTLTEVLLLPKLNNTPESGLEPWFLVSVSCMLYLLSNPTNSMWVSHQCSVSLRESVRESVFSEHNPDIYYVSSVNLFAVAINIISIDRVNGDKNVGECSSFKNAIPCFNVLLQKCRIEFVYLCWFWTFIYRLTVHPPNMCGVKQQKDISYFTVQLVKHGARHNSWCCFIIIKVFLLFCFCF